jgi:hypothetical protein
VQIAFPKMLNFQSDLDHMTQTSVDDINSSSRFENMNYNCPSLNSIIQQAANLLIADVQSSHAESTAIIPLPYTFLLVLDDCRYLYALFSPFSQYCMTKEECTFV